MPKDVQTTRTSPNSALAVATFDESREAVISAIQRATEKLPNWNVERHTDDVIHIVRTTRLFRFKDDIIVRITSTEGGSKAEITSASRVGKGDLGQNPRNIQEFLEAVDRELTELGG